MSGLRLLLGAVDLSVPAVQSPRLVAVHGQQGLVSGLSRRADGRHYRNVQVTGHWLVRSGGVGGIKGELLSRGEVVSRSRGVHVLVRVGGRGLRAARLNTAVMRHSARVVATAKVAVRKRRAGGVLSRGAWAALLHRFPHARRWRVGGCVRRAGGQRRGVRHQVPALISSKVASSKTLHVLAHFIRAVFVEEHERRVEPARTEQQ